MSCRRADIRDLKGCWIGEVGVRGCSRGCCPYGDEDYSENNRHHFVGRGYEHRDRTTTHPDGREGLYYDKCQTSYRPKFICARKECRRGIKPFFDEDLMEYRIDQWQNWEVRPVASRSEGLREATRSAREMAKPRSNPELVERSRKRQELRKRVPQVGGEWWEVIEGEPTMEKLTDEEMKWLKKHDPEMWWLNINSTSLAWWKSEVHAKRCPSCGNAVLRVGSNFRIPAKKDDKAWKLVEGMIMEDVDLVAKFSVCATFEKHEDMIDEASRINSGTATIGSWEEEKQRRIKALGLQWEPESKVPT